DHPYIPPGPNDLRGPCPGLNTFVGGLFFFSFLLLGLFQLLFSDGYHMEPDILAIAAKVATLTSRDPLSFTLDDIKLHGNIEHDASVSRADFITGDNVHFNETIFSVLANANPGVDYYNTTSAGQVQHIRLAQSAATNPNLTNTDKEFFIRSVESSFYLSAMGDPVTGVAPKNFVQIFFREERLPIAEGWKRSEVPINSDTLGPLFHSIAAQSNW
ncbi:hypothetical protein K435DRAFT_576124, partial [Dendrothele bispora CBS 962.96]